MRTRKLVIAGMLSLIPAMLTSVAFAGSESVSVSGVTINPNSTGPGHAVLVTAGER